MKESEFYRLMDAIESGGADAVPKAIQCFQPTVEFIETALRNQKVEEFVPALIYYSMYAVDADCREYCKHRLTEVQLTTRCRNKKCYIVTAFFHAELYQTNRTPLYEKEVHLTLTSAEKAKRLFELDGDFERVVIEEVFWKMKRPDFNRGDTVNFEWQDGVKTGEVYIVDEYGTFELPGEPSYDIMVGEALYKHVSESEIIGKVMDQSLVYEAIETAAKTGKPVELPYGTELKTIMRWDRRFLVEDLLWWDERGVACRAVLEPELHKGKDSGFIFSGMYVVICVTEDGFSSGNTKVFRKENRKR